MTVLIEFSEWLLRNKYETSLVKENLLMASDILLEVEFDDNLEDKEEEGDGAQTIFSRSSRGKMSNMNRSERTGASRSKRGRGQMTVGGDSRGMSRIQKSTANSRMSKTGSKRDN